jgi:hypothetical protein
MIPCIFLRFGFREVNEVIELVFEWGFWSVIGFGAPLDFWVFLGNWLKVEIMETLEKIFTDADNFWGGREGGVLELGFGIPVIGGWSWLATWGLAAVVSRE